MCVQSDTSLLEERHRQQLRDLEEAMKSTWEAKSKVPTRMKTHLHRCTHKKYIHAPVHINKEINTFTSKYHNILLHLSLPSLLAPLHFFFSSFFLCPPLVSSLSFSSDLYIHLPLSLLLSFTPTFLCLYCCLLHPPSSVFIAVFYTRLLCHFSSHMIFSLQPLSYAFPLQYNTQHRTKLHTT